ncbi:hypothetical protein QP775_17455 [Paenibacillus sp. UMB4589-SE434]|nr:hypothetical protein [Paenibacillus sp. UMB4589-SE434]
MTIIKRSLYATLLLCFMFSGTVYGEMKTSLTSKSPDSLYDNKYGIESFESGSYLHTNYSAGAGLITNNPNQIINGNYSAFLEADPQQEWKDLMYTDSNKIHFERNTTYAVTFSYKSITQPAEGNNGYFYFTARGVGADYRSDKGWTEWNEKAGKKGTKTIVFKTGDEANYFLIWGIHNGGALSVDDIIIQKRSESFEQGSYTSTKFLAGAGSITTDPDQIISGKNSAFLKADSTVEWKDMMYTDSNKVQFEKNTTYTVTFSYKSITQPVEDNNGYFYFTARGVGADYRSDKGWTEWNEKTGKKGTKTIEFKTGDEANYFLIWGIHNGGALSVDDVIIKKNEYQYDSNNRLKSVSFPYRSEITYIYDANGNIVRREVK